MTSTAASTGYSGSDRHVLAAACAGVSEGALKVRALARSQGRTSGSCRRFPSGNKFPDRKRRRGGTSLAPRSAGIRGLTMSPKSSTTTAGCAPRSDLQTASVKSPGQRPPRGRALSAADERAQGSGSVEPGPVTHAPQAPETGRGTGAVLFLCELTRDPSLPCGRNFSVWSRLSSVSMMRASPSLWGGSTAARAFARSREHGQRRKRGISSTGRFCTELGAHDDCRAPSQEVRAWR